MMLSKLEDLLLVCRTGSVCDRNHWALPVCRHGGLSTILLEGTKAELIIELEP